jgi:carboxyl-terminal processing protease
MRVRQIASAIFLMMSIAIAWPSLATRSKAEQFHSARSNGQFSRSLHGVWRNQGNGWILSISTYGASLYNETKTDCLRDPASSMEIADNLAAYWRGTSNWIELASQPEVETYRFERIAKLPAQCLRSPSANPTAVFNSLVASLTEQYPDFAARKISWPALVASARQKLRNDMTDDELFALLSSLLVPLQDSHVRLADPKNPNHVFQDGYGKTLTAYETDFANPFYPDRSAMRADFIQRWKDNVAQTLIPDTFRVRANGRFVSGMLTPDVAYLAPIIFYGLPESLNQIEAEALFSREMDDSFKSFAQAKALVIDLSNHRGGAPNMDRMLVARVASKPALGSLLYNKRFPHNPKRWEVVQDRQRPRFDGPVYVLTSDITKSAGEFELLLLRAQPNTLVVGQRTRGEISGLIRKTLPNGWTLQIPNQFMVTPAGNNFSGRGIPPEIYLPVYQGRGAEIFQSHRAALQTIAAHFKTCGAALRSIKPCW